MPRTRKFFEAVVNYRHFVAMGEKKEKGQQDEQERAGFFVVTHFLSLLATTHLPSEAQEQLLARFRKAEILEPTDTVAAAYDFLAYEIAYAPFVCQLLNLPTRNEEAEIEKGNEHATAQ